MALPSDVRASLDDALTARGFGTVISVEPIGGGCIGNAMSLRTAAGARLFLKWSRGLPHRIFAEEANALRVMADTRTVRVPAVLALHDEVDEDVRWLLLEWLEPGAAADHSWQALGAALARMHRVTAAAPGWPTDNFIGSLPQQNGELADWPSFWRERRLEPQLRRACDGRLLDAADRARFDLLLDRLDDLLGAVRLDGTSLLHGDLWNGNALTLADGAAALIDPAAYHGHREVDLAMAELFGGFSRRFFDAYDAAWPIEPGYQRRRPLYQLYYLLVHVNLFGRSYRARTLDTLRDAGF